jgi:hypothetical protein
VIGFCEQTRKAFRESSRWLWEPPRRKENLSAGKTARVERKGVFYMKRDSFFRAGILALALMFAMAGIGCETGTNGGGKAGLDKALVAKWYIYPTQVDDPDEEPVFEISSDGRLTGSSVSELAEILVTTSGKKISATVTVNGETAESGTATYSVTGNKLLLTNPMLNGAQGGVFLPFITAIQLAQSIGASLGADGHFHKSGASGASGGEEGGGTGGTGTGTGGTGTGTGGTGTGTGGTGTGTGGTGTGTGGGGSTSVGCSSLSDGTKCSAQSGCSGKFLCQTGQGSDSNCTSGCSCKG